MAEYFAGGHLRFVNGEWRNDDGNIVEISRVRHGKWIKRKSWDFHVCSECSFEKSPSNYCPNCGAKMDGWSIE